MSRRYFVKALSEATGRNWIFLCSPIVFFENLYASFYDTENIDKIRIHGEYRLSLHAEYITNNFG